MIIFFYKNHTYQVSSDEEAMINVNAFIAENKAQQQEIAELGADKVQFENDACVARGEIERLTAENAELKVALEEMSAFNNEVTAENAKLKEQLGAEGFRSREQRQISKELQAENKAQAEENKRLNELVFAYESISAPVNPLLAENKALTERIERLNTENRVAECVMVARKLEIKRLKQTGKAE